MTPESGTGHRCRSRRRRGLRVAAFTAVAALTLGLAACTGGEAPAGGSDGGAGSSASDGPAANSATPPAPTLDAGSKAACLTIFGDPDYKAPLIRTVLDRAATALTEGADDPGFYAMTGDDLTTAVSGVGGEVSHAAGDLTAWFRDEAAKGGDADLDLFAQRYTALADACAPVSDAATWIAHPGPDGTKPAVLVCASITDTPSTLNVYRNANVLTSNMFYVAGLYPRTVTDDQMDQVRGTDELLAREIAAVDDDGVRAALEEIRAPFQAALDGRRHSPGLQKPMETFGRACKAVGYDIPPMTESGQDDGGLV